VIVGGREEKHTEGSYVLAHAGRWIPAGENATSAEHQRKLRLNQMEAQ